MSLPLSDILTLVGRLDDSPGFDTPRERFRRYISEQVHDVAALRRLLTQCQERLGDQHARARQDLIMLLGRFLGFEVHFGAYDARGAARIEGHWRSRRRARLAVAVLSEQSTEDEAEHLARAMAALRAATPVDEERWVGLCITTPFYVTRQRLETALVQRPAGDIRCVSLESVLWLADTASDDRLPHDDVVRLLTSGPDSDFMIGLMRRFTETAAASAPPAAAAPTGPRVVPPPATASQATSPLHTPAPLFVDRRAAAAEEPVSGCWLASLVRDEAATPEQILDSVIGRRQVLGIGESAPSPAAPRAGDRVCFVIEGSGAMGHAELDAVISDATPPIRGARRFSAVFRLRHVVLYDMPVAIDGNSVVRGVLDQMPAGATGAYLAPLPRADYDWLTSGGEGALRVVG
jgi:hypothetical protein